MHFLSVGFFTYIISPLLFCFSLGWGGRSVCCCSDCCWRLSAGESEFSSWCSSFLSVVLCVPSAGGGPVVVIQDALPPLLFFLPTLVLLDLPQSNCAAPPAHAGHALSSWRSCVWVCVRVCVCTHVVRVVFLFLWIPRQEKEGDFAPLLQRLMARFRLWISSPIPSHLSNGAFLAVKFHLHYNES